MKIQEPSQANITRFYFLSVSNYSLTIHPQTVLNFFWDYSTTFRFPFWNINCLIYLPLKGLSTVFPVVFKIYFWLSAVYIDALMFLVFFVYLIQFRAFFECRFFVFAQSWMGFSPVSLTCLSHLSSFSLLLSISSFSLSTLARVLFSSALSSSSLVFYSFVSDLLSIHL